MVASLLLRDYTTFKVGLTYLEKLNLPRWENDGMISMAMGGFSKGMSPMQMASAYTVFAYKGVYWEPYFYTLVEDYEGNKVLEKAPKPTKVFSEQTAFIMNDILQDVVTEGTGVGNLVMNKDGEAIPTAGKTGTADRSIDKWFCGATPYYVASTWYGYDNSKAQISMTSEETNNAKKIWHAVMTRIHEDLKPTPFFSSTPAKIVTRKICKDSGKLATSLCEQDPRGSRVVEEYFIDGTEPDYGDSCKVHFMAKVCSADTDSFGRPVLANDNCPAETVEQQVRIRRPVEYSPMFPTDPYPEDWKYGINEDLHCLIHTRSVEAGITPIPVTPTPVPTYVPFRPY